MKSIRYTLLISALAMLCGRQADACVPYDPDKPTTIRTFRCCSPELEQQWQGGCRFQDYEKEENCLLWQAITSRSIPLKDIENVVYAKRLDDIKALPDSSLHSNAFATWLSNPRHREDLDYILVAKEIEELRDYMNNPWYYPYDGDAEHLRLAQLLEKCRDYNGRRHKARYALQMARIYFAQKDYQECIDLWENSVCDLPHDILTDMIASYAGGAYSRMGNRDKAIALFTRSQDIGSLISLKAWGEGEEASEYTDSYVQELDYIFSRFPNSPLLSVKLQGAVEMAENYTLWDYPDNHSGQLKRFALKAIASKDCRQKAMWHYALAYLYYLDGRDDLARQYLAKAERAEGNRLVKESVRAFRFLMDARYASDTQEYKRRLLQELKWLDSMMERDIKLSPDEEWQYANRLNWRVSFWQDVARRVLLGEICPRMEKAGNTTLALQLANYASNRCYQLAPLYKDYHYGWSDEEDSENYTVIMPFDEFRKSWPGNNYFDYRSQFFELINSAAADDAAKYAQRIENPATPLDKFLNERSYVDTDYIYDIVGTLYLREMNYDKAAEWLARVSESYQARTNIAKDGYFKRDPFRLQADKPQNIADSSDYKLKFAQEMSRLEKLIKSNAEPNRKANAKIRYATGLRNSFGKCWYLTAYGCGEDYDNNYYLHNRPATTASMPADSTQSPAAKAYGEVDRLMAEALAEFTDPEQAARAHLEMMNHKTLMSKYPDTQAAATLRGRCDTYHDYALHTR